MTSETKLEHEAIRNWHEEELILMNQITAEWKSIPSMEFTADDIKWKAIQQRLIEEFKKH